MPTDSFATGLLAAGQRNVICVVLEEFLNCTSALVVINVSYLDGLCWLKYLVNHFINATIIQYELK